MPADGCSLYPTLISTKHDRIKYLSFDELMTNHNFIMPLYIFPSLTHLALDYCSHIGSSLAAYKSAILKHIRIGCYALDTTKFPKSEELEKISHLLSSFNGLELLALDSSWTTFTTDHRSVWLRIPSAISNNHASTLGGLVLRDRLSTYTTIEKKTARIEAAKKYKNLRALEIMEVEKTYRMNFLIR